MKVIKKIRLISFFLVVTVLLTSGCAVNRATATVDPSADLIGVKKVYVQKFAPDSRGINVLIANKLKSMGYEVDTGTFPSGEQVDVLVTYKDKWMWDITMYMLELTVVIRDPKNNFPLASGNSFHTSLSRKPPEEMVDEVVENIFKKVEK